MVGRGRPQTQTHKNTLLVMNLLVYAFPSVPERSGVRRMGSNFRSSDHEAKQSLSWKKLGRVISYLRPWFLPLVSENSNDSLELKDTHTHTHWSCSKLLPPGDGFAVLSSPVFDANRCRLFLGRFFTNCRWIGFFSFSLSLLSSWNANKIPLYFGFLPCCCFSWHGWLGWNFEAEVLIFSLLAEE